MSRKSGDEDPGADEMTEGVDTVEPLHMDDSLSQSSDDGEFDAPPSGHPWFLNRRPAERRGEGEIFDPPAEWLVAFREQATAKAFSGALGYAYKKAELVQIAGLHVDDDYVAALVQDAIGDTATGRIRWRHDRVSLVNHIKDTIRARTSRQIVRARKFRHESIEASADEGDDYERPTEIEASLALRNGSEDRDDLAVSDVVVQVFDAVQVELGDDPSAIMVLDAYRLQLTDRREILEHTGMSDDDYHNARRRFTRAVLRLPDELRAAAAEVMSR